MRSTLAALCAANFSSGADELAEQLVVAERLEADAVRRALDLDPASPRWSRGLDVEH